MGLSFASSLFLIFASRFTLKKLFFGYVFEQLILAKLTSIFFYFFSVSRKVSPFFEFASKERFLRIKLLHFLEVGNGDPESAKRDRMNGVGIEPGE
jgi:hypothetical protein